MTDESGAAIHRAVLRAIPPLEQFDMADEPDPKPLTETIPSRLGETSALASANAPFVYFDAASTYGFSEGVGNVTLEAFRNMSVGGKVVRDRVIVAHLRMSLHAAKDLRAALDGVLLMASPKKPQSQEH